MFVIQNRLQNCCEKIQTEISMRQWLLLAMADSCTKEKTLTNLGELMGCSRQNVKKLALQLEKKGFVTLSKGAKNTVTVESTQLAAEYSAKLHDRQTELLQLLFSHFDEEDLATFYQLYKKMYVGLERVEEYTKKSEK